MLSPDFTAVDLNPATWGNLGIIADMIQPWERILYILHDKGKVMNIFHPVRGLVYDMEIDPLHAELHVDRILAGDSGIDSIWICDRNSLTDYFYKVNSADITSCDTDEYMSFAYTLLNNFRGIEIYGRGTGYADIYGKLRQYVAGGFPGDCTIVLGIFKEARLFFDVVLGFEKHKVKLITTLDHFKMAGYPDRILMRDLDEVRDNVKAKSGDPVFVFFMDISDFAEKIINLKKSQ